MKTAWSKFCLCVFVILFTSCGLIVTGSARAESWKAGVASVKITPTQYMWMAGYASRKHPADGTFADLWARTLVLEDTAGNRGALVSLDLVGMDRAMSESICRTLQQQYGLKRAQVALCFTHTHSGPVVGKSLEPLHYRQLDAQQQQLVDQYAEQLEKHVVQSVGTAIEDLKPCRAQLGIGRSHVRGESPEQCRRRCASVAGQQCLEGAGRSCGSRVGGSRRGRPTAGSGLRLRLSCDGARRLQMVRRLPRFCGGRTGSSPSRLRRAVLGRLRSGSESTTPARTAIGSRIRPSAGRRCLTRLEWRAAACDRTTGGLLSGSAVGVG